MFTLVIYTDDYTRDLFCQFQFLGCFSIQTGQVPTVKIGEESVQSLLIHKSNDKFGTACLVDGPLKVEICPIALQNSHEQLMGCFAVLLAFWAHGLGISGLFCYK
jgi:hypothetical protein